MKNWPSHRLQKLFNIELPLIQAPMAGVDSVELAAAVSNAGGLGSLACALLSVDQLREEFKKLRSLTTMPVNLNFFCHENPKNTDAQQAGWKEHLSKYYLQLGLDPNASYPTALRVPFNEDYCAVVEELKPEVVSFHFGLPSLELMKRLRSVGCKIISSATTVTEARWLEERGCDAIIAQGFEAGGHRGSFLTHDIAAQVGTMALVPQIVDAVKVPVIAAGGISDARGIAASFLLGACGVQLGTAYLFCPEAKVSKLYLQTLQQATDDQTVLTNVYSGKPARGIRNKFIQEEGPISTLAPPFPFAGPAVNPLRKKSEELGRNDFVQMWSGQAASLGRVLPAAELTKKLSRETLALLVK
ncbi:2-nitropropane dioxygenase [Bdellovibrio bacteriovorus]|uniref:Nitronate monooxygenase n=1 Tax=Bdellovibrio bacteriovorus TaxID=959 RepID=A0A162GYB4_BDEBC|nr:nitronate monooxygenase [Bdellovibrio bacteriovorus]KYG69220.1 2-nitropropane dioxygenase [Bdellovibrio bacteriovorus]